MLNGGTGVMKSMMGGQCSASTSISVWLTNLSTPELTDSTNIAQAFAYIPATWAIGVTIG